VAAGSRFVAEGGRNKNGMEMDVKIEFGKYNICYLLFDDCINFCCFRYIEWNLI